MFKRKKWIQIRFNFDGNPYFIYKGRKWYLDDFMRASGQPYHGYLTLCNISSMVIKLNDGADALKVAILR